MNILVYQWGSVNDHVLQFEAEIWSRQYNKDLKEKIQFYYFYRKMTNYDMDPEFAMALLENVNQNKIDAIISFNYFPMVSSICEVTRIKYISWIYDSPHKTLYSKTIFNQGNFLFIFDKQLFELVQSRGARRVFYQPLAVSAEYFATKRDQQIENFFLEEELETVRSSVTFVGALYREHHNYYESLVDMAEVTKNDIDSILKSQTFSYKENLVKNKMNDDLALAICDKAKLYLEDQKYFNDNNEFAADLIRKKVTAVEREIALMELSKQFPTVIYTNVKTADLPQIINYGYADYDTKMPTIFQESAINLNITLRSIQSGISLRVLDILACGGFLITNWQKEIEEYFVIGEELVTFESLEDLITKTDYYLKHPEERIRIAKAGKKKVEEMFSYMGAINNIVGKAMLI